MSSLDSSNDDSPPGLTRSESALLRYKRQKAALAAAKERSDSLPTKVSPMPAFGRSITEMSNERRRSSDAAQLKKQLAFLDYEMMGAGGAEASQKDEVDLSISILEHVLDQCRGMANKDSAAGGKKEMERVIDQLSNAALLLHKFKTDARASAALKESHWKNAISRNLSSGSGAGQSHGSLASLGQEDQEVVQFISESVFTPAELRDIKHKHASDQQNGLQAPVSAADYFHSPRANDAAQAASPTHRKRGDPISISRSSFSELLLPVTDDSNTGTVEQKEHSKMEPEERTRAIKGLISDNEQLQQCLSHVDSWDDFNVFTLDAMCGARLTVLMTHLFTSLGLFTEFNIPRVVFTNFCVEIERRYRDNPYHNAIHATDVVQSMYVFLRTESLAQNIASVDVLAGLLAAAVHDVAHPGTNNAYQIAISSPLAVRYNDRSVLENMHIAEAFKLMSNPQCDILQGLDPSTRKEVRESMIVMVLATDMAAHLQVIAEMESSLEAKKETKTWFSKETRADRLLLLKTALHCADVSNPCKPLDVYKKWVDGIVQEWWAQGDLERKAGLEVSALMDRGKPNVPGSQVGFIDYFIKPLYEVWHRVLPEISFCMDNLSTNRQYYQEQVAAEKR